MSPACLSSNYRTRGWFWELAVGVRSGGSLVDCSLSLCSWPEVPVMYIYLIMYMYAYIQIKTYEKILNIWDYLVL